MVTHRTSTLSKCSRIFRVVDKKIIEEKIFIEESYTISFLGKIDNKFEFI